MNIINFNAINLFDKTECEIFTRFELNIDENVSNLYLLQLKNEIAITNKCFVVKNTRKFHRLNL